MLIQEMTESTRISFFLRSCSNLSDSFLIYCMKAEQVKYPIPNGQAVFDILVYIPGRKTWHYLTQGYRKEEFKNMSRSNAEFTFSMPVLVTCKFDEELIKMKPLSCPHFLQYMSKLNKFDAQGQVTPKPMIRSGRESNLSKILCLFSSPASCLPI